MILAESAEKPLQANAFGTTCTSFLSNNRELSFQLSSQSLHGPALHFLLGGTSLRRQFLFIAGVLDISKL